LNIFRHLKISDCHFEENISTILGDDLFLENTFELVELSEITVKKSNKNSIYVYLSNIKIDGLEIENNVGVGAKGGGLLIIDAISFELHNGKFTNLSSQEGGAIFISQTKNDDCPYTVLN
jgi:hypothetical protein